VGLLYLALGQNRPSTAEKSLGVASTEGGHTPKTEGNPKGSDDKLGDPPIPPAPPITEPERPLPKEPTRPLSPLPLIEDKVQTPVQTRPTVEPKNNPALDQSKHPAKLVVARQKLMPLDVAPLPDFLQGASAYTWEEHPKTDVANAVLEFIVEGDGIVYLAPTWKNEGNAGGNWVESRLTKEQLVQQGWQDLGTCSWDADRTLLCRNCKAGETFSLRTNKYWPATVILPKGEGAGQSSVG